MLKPIRKPDRPQAFATLDIETDREGYGTHFGYYDRGMGFVLYKDQRDFVDFLCNKSNVKILYAHAGMRFDYSLLLRSLMELGEITIAYSAAEGVFAKWFAGNREITLADSYRLLPASLRSLTDKFVPEAPKIDLDGMPWELPENELITYLERDCVSLYLTIERFWDFIDRQYGVCRSLTLSSLAMKIYRRRFLRSPIMTSNKKIYDFERQSYFGGICVCHRPGRYDMVSVYDINSMYPCMMRNFDYPTSYVGAWTTDYRGRRGLYKVTFSDPSNVPFIYDLNSRAIASFGEAIIDDRTLVYLREIGGRVDVSFGYEYYHWGDLFSEYVDHFFNLKKESEEPYRTVYKLLLNSLYGKFGQGRDGRELSTVEPPGMFKSYAVECSEGNFELFDYRRSRVVRHSFPAIATLVTLRARMFMHRLIHPHAESFLYCDTDSIHLKGQPEIPCGAGLGELKLEYQGAAVYVGKKIYELTDIGKRRCKGVPSKAVGDRPFGEVKSKASFDFDTFTSIRGQLTGKPFARSRVTRTIDFSALDDKLDE